MEQKVLVSIQCLVYNHEPYLRQCLDGFVMQKTNFAFEAIVHDDVSTDHSADIIREYAEKYPSIIKPIYEKENQYSKTDGSLIRIMNAAVDINAKYIAFCEGDDYWIDPYKLQKQVDFMEMNINYSMCFHDVYRLYGGKLQSSYRQYYRNTDACLYDVIINGGLFCPTASILLRKNIYDKYPDFAKRCHVGDYPMQIYMALKGKVRFMKDIMGVYRIGTEGSWTDRMRRLDANMIKDKMNDEICMLESFNDYSEHKYNNIFSKRISIYRIRTFIRLRDKDAIRNSISADWKNINMKLKLCCFFVLNNLSFVLDVYYKLRGVNV